MGYSTDFTGVLRTDKPIPAQVAAEMRHLSETDTRDMLQLHTYGLVDVRPYPGFHCDFEPTPANDGVRWNGCEKTYGAVAWINYLIRNHLEPNGITIPDGEHLDAQGEDPGDIWRLKIVDGKAIRLEARIEYVEK